MTIGIATPAPPVAALWRRRLANIEPITLLWVLLAGVLVLLVVLPIGRLVLVSLQDPESGAFTLANYAGAYGRSRYLEALWNSLQLGLWVSVLSLVLAVPLAWATARTDMPGRRFTRLMVLGAFMIPPYLGAIGWMLLGGPNAGWLNRAWMWLTGAESGLFDIYSFWGLVFVIALHNFPYVYVFVASALELVSSELEDAAAILGAGPVRTTFRVTLPIVLPAVVAGFIVCFLETIALFGTPALIALPARFNVVTTQLWQFFEFPTRVELAAAYAMPLLLITVAMFALQKLMLARKGFVAVTGKGGERRQLRLGAWRWPLFAWSLFVATLAVILPMLVLLQSAFARAWGRGFSLDNLTLKNFRYILFDHEQARASIFNSFNYGAAAACLALVLALAIAYLVNRRLVRFGGVLAFLCMAPFVIPGIVMAIGFYATYAPPPIALYGSAWILILAFAARFLPIAYANSSAAVRAINPEMEEAVRILGGSRLTAIGRVVAPLLKRSLAGAWLLVFIPATRELSAAIFLVGPNTRVMSVLLYDLSEEGNFEHLAALGVVLLAATFAFSLLGFRILGRDFMVRNG